MKNITKFLWIFFVAFSVAACSDWLDINDDPDAPTKPEIAQLLSGSEVFMVEPFGQGFFLGNGLSTVTHHIVTREQQNYGISTTDNNTMNSWTYWYLYALPNFDAIINYAEPQGCLIYAGIAKTLKAYTFATMVDLWGDIPFSEYNVPGLTTPHSDPSASIYNALIDLLEEAIADFQNTAASNELKPDEDDLFYGGDVTKWVRVNNTIKLKLLLQTRLAKSDITDWQSRFNALMSASNFIAAGEDFQFWYTSKVQPDERHPAFSSQYASTNRTIYISPFFYEIMKGYTYNYTNNPFSGITDPRVPYYFYNQLTTTGASQNHHEYRDGGFLSIFFASNSPNSSSSQNNSMTVPGIYPCGGKYDAGTGGVVGAATGNGAAPTKLLTYHQLKFMLAELALAGETSADAKTLLKEGMDASIAHVNTVAGKQTGVPTISNTNRDNFTSAVLATYDAASAARKMEIVMTQKWIGQFFSPVDSYNDYRRTGYPVLFNPANTSNPGNGVNPTPTANSLATVPILPLASYPRSLYYPASTETERNPNMPQKTNLSQKFVFWDK